MYVQVIRRIDPKSKIESFVVQTVTAERTFPTMEAAEAHKKKLDQKELQRRRRAMQHEL